MEKEIETIIVSACLLGIPTRYDGGDSRSTELIKNLSGSVTVALCPEELGGLATPRAPSEITGGGNDGCDVLKDKARVVDKDGRDVTCNFIKGAEEVLRIADLLGAKEAFLKEKSPSCGVRLIKKNGRDFEGAGVLTALLKKNNIKTTGVL